MIEQSLFERKVDSALWRWYSENVVIHRHQFVILPKPLVIIIPWLPTNVALRFQHTFTTVEGRPGPKLFLTSRECRKGTSLKPEELLLCDRLQSSVPKVRIELTRVSPHDFESCASACSATSAFSIDCCYASFTSELTTSQSAIAALISSL